MKKRRVQKYEHVSDCSQSRKVSPGDNRNISCLHHGEQAAACTIMQQTTIYHCPQDEFIDNLRQIAVRLIY
ncbi:hypothetical protein [Acetobacterium bakii]|uniref:hypothetical protein n=1 Tax=Acetobacterium bakii TaxID=52689 RepID=UPI000F8D45E4|nr:hypothetical protein [Acetobacterium bakii]